VVAPGLAVPAQGRVKISKNVFLHGDKRPSFLARAFVLYLRGTHGQWTGVGGRPPGTKTSLIGLSCSVLGRGSRGAQQAALANGGCPSIAQRPPSESDLMLTFREAFFLLPCTGKMEGRNHSSAAFIPAGSVSRMKGDLIKCSEDLFVGFRPRPAIRDRPAGKTPHVGVIGTGLAGLRCAEVLVDGGAKVTLLEARDRIGGRVSLSLYYSRRVFLGNGHSNRLKIHQVNLGGQAMDMYDSLRFQSRFLRTC